MTILVPYSEIVPFQFQECLRELKDHTVCTLGTNETEQRVQIEQLNLKDARRVLSILHKYRRR